MKTLHVVLSLDVGGLERVVLLLVAAAQRAGDEVAVVCLDDRGDLAATLTKTNVPCWSGEDFPNMERKSRDRAVMSSAITEFQPDVVHTHQIGALYRIGKFVKHFSKVPIVHTEHGNHLATANSWWRKLKNRWIWYRSATFCEAFCCVSEEIRDSMIRVGVPDKKARVVYNGVETSLFPSKERISQVRADLGINSDHVVIGSLGRLSPVKRLDILLNSFAKIAHVLANARLVIVGDGPTRSELQAQSERMGLASRVVFAGYQDTPQDFLAAFDVLALSSESEGMPMAILEAFVQGVPVVATRVGAIKDMIADGRTGFLVPFGEPNALANQILTILTNAKLRGELSQECRRVVVERFSHEAMYRQYKDISTQLMTHSRN